MKLRLAILFVALAATGLAGCATHLPGRAARPACCVKAEATTVFTDKSLYQLDSLWTTDDSEQIRLSELSGRSQVVAMFFANCQFACPIRLKAIIGWLGNLSAAGRMKHKALEALK